MTRDEAIELLELMKRQQNQEESVAPLDSERLAQGYVRIASSRRSNGRDSSRDGGPTGRDCEEP